MRERHVHGLGRAGRLDDLPVLAQLVRAELDLDGDRGDRDDGDPDERLRRARERLEIHGGDEPAVHAHRLPPLLDRARVVPPGPPHAETVEA